MWHLISVYNQIGIETYSLNPINVLVCFAFLHWHKKKRSWQPFFGPDNPTVNAMVLTAGPDNPRGPGNQRWMQEMSW